MKVRARRQGLAFGLDRCVVSVLELSFGVGLLLLLVGLGLGLGLGL